MTKFRLPLNAPQYDVNLLRDLAADRPADPGVAMLFFATDKQELSYFDPAGGWRTITGETLSATTTDGTVTRLSEAGDGSPTMIMLPSNSTILIEASVVGRSDAGTENAGYVARCVAKRDVAAGSVAIIGSEPGVVFEPQSAWNVTFTADTTNGAVNVNVVGEAAKTIRWAASVRVTILTAP